MVGVEKGKMKNAFHVAKLEFNMGLGSQKIEDLFAF